MEKPNRKLRNLTLKIAFIFIFCAFVSIYTVISFIISPFFYMHNGLLNLRNAEKINDTYINTNFEVDWGIDFLSIKQYIYNYEVDGKTYSITYYLDEDDEYYKGINVYYNRNNPEDSFIYNKHFKFESGSVIYSSIMLFGGFSFLIYILYKIVCFINIGKEDFKHNKKSTV